MAQCRADVSSGIGDGTDDARPRRSSARVAALRTEMTALLHELRHNPSETRMDDVNECLEELDSTVKVAAVEELTEAMLSDEFPADRLAEVADTQDDVAFQEQVGVSTPNGLAWVWNQEWWSRHNPVASHLHSATCAPRT